MQKSEDINFEPSDEWKRQKRPLMYMLSADLNPVVLKKIELQGFNKGYSMLTA
jgi:hypothetical protein